MLFTHLFCDIDGTLIGPDGTIPADSRAGIEEFRRVGGRVYLATGRPITSAWGFHERLGLDTPLITCNGASIVEVGQRRALASWHVGECWSRLHEVLLAATPADTALVGFFDDRVMALNASPAQDEFRRVDGGVVHDLADGMPEVPPLKLIAFGSHAAALAEIERTVRDGFAEVECVYSSATTLEIMPVGVGKETAVNWLITHLGIGREDTAAVGDNHNDAGMLASVRYAFGVRGGAAEVVGTQPYLTRASQAEGAVGEVARIGAGAVALPDMRTPALS